MNFRERGDGVRLTEKEAELIDFYRKQDEKTQAEISRIINAAYEDALRAEEENEESQKNNRSPCR